jgi:hypothetical protein
MEIDNDPDNDPDNDQDNESYRTLRSPSKGKDPGGSGG